MAITLADFTKIWASTSPLTPYSFTESNYKEGWNFIGGTPPSRQMWDSIQNQNDEKLKYIVDNFLPLDGGTMTGAIVLADGGNPLSTAGGTMTGAISFDETGQIGYRATTHTEPSNPCKQLIVSSTDIDHWSNEGGAKMSLHTYDTTQTNVQEDGSFGLLATDGTDNKELKGKPNGDLTWNGKNLDYCADLSIFADYENFTTPTVFSNRIKVVPSGDFGGYKQVGKVVYVHYTFQMNMNMNKGAWTIAQGFPRPYIDGGAWSVVPIAVSAWYGDNESGYFTSASIDGNGSLYLILSGNVTAGSSGDTNHGIVVHGVYLAK